MYGDTSPDSPPHFRELSSSRVRQVKAEHAELYEEQTIDRYYDRARIRCPFLPEEESLQETRIRRSN